MMNFPDTHKKKIDLIFDKTTVAIDFEKLKQNIRIQKLLFMGVMTKHVIDLLVKK